VLSTVSLSWMGLTTDAITITIKMAGTSRLTRVDGMANSIPHLSAVLRQTRYMIHVNLLPVEPTPPEDPR
jgi:hypothetical protein